MPYPIYTDSEIEEIAVAAFGRAFSFPDESSKQGACDRVREEVKRTLQNRKAAEEAHTGAKRQRVLAASLKYPHVIFPPYYKVGLNGYWPEGVRVHERRSGQNQTLCGISFDPGKFKSEPEVHPRKGPNTPYLKACRTCRAAGGLTTREEQILYVERLSKLDRRLAQQERVTVALANR